jgi:hypothetical protein
VGPFSLPMITISTIVKKINVASSNFMVWGDAHYEELILFFKVPMFKLQPCHYEEGFSQCFCILW